MHSSNRLKWACQLKVGDHVQVKMHRGDEAVAGVIKGSGTHHLFAGTYGLHFVVEIAVNSLISKHM